MTSDISRLTFFCSDIALAFFLTTLMLLVVEFISTSLAALTSITIFCTLVVSGNGGGGLFRSAIFGIGESSTDGSDIVRDGIESEKIMQFIRYKRNVEQDWLIFFIFSHFLGTFDDFSKWSVPKALQNIEKFVFSPFLGSDFG